MRAAGVADAALAARGLAGGQAPRILRATPEVDRRQVSDALHAAAVHGLHGTVLVCGVAGLAAGAVVFLLMGPRPAAVEMRPEPEAQPADA